MDENIRIVMVIMALSLLLPSIASASSGIGISTPTNESMTIEKFPFHYQDSFRIYNTGDEDGVYTINVNTEYQDVKDWVSLDKSIFTLKPEESTLVTFSIDAEEAYTGSYTVVFQSVILPKGSDEKSTGVGAVAYLALGQPFKFTIKISNGSLGERPSTPVATPTPELSAEIAKNIRESGSGIVKTWIGTPIYLDMPSNVSLNDPVEMSASFIEGGEPADMGLLLVSPSGEEYQLSRSDTFRFDEEGAWSAMVVIGGEVILGRPIHVQPQPETAAHYAQYIAPAVALAILALLVVILLRRR